MATVIEQEGGLLKIKVDGVIQTPLNLFELNPSVNGDFVIFPNGAKIDFNDVTSPTVASAEDLFNQIGVFIYNYNTGK